MEAYYLVNDPSSTLATSARNIRKLEFKQWENSLPDLDSDIELVIHSLATHTGLGKTKTKNIAFALYRLRELPRLRTMQLDSYFLDMTRLCTIDSALNKLGAPTPEILQRVDEALCKFFTPTSPAEVLPSSRAIRTFIHDLIKLLAPEIDPEKGEEEANNSYSTYPVPGGKEAISAEYEPATAYELDQRIKDTAEKLEITPAEALEKLIRGEANSETIVILNMYRASDIPNAPAFIQGAGWVSPEIADSFEPKVVRDMAKAATAESPSYTTPSTIGAFIEGRDGTCRMPHCDRPAQDCQKDHRINFAEGGPTAGSNLASLCQHHHNIKTDGRANYIMDPLTGDIVWLFDDGHWEYDEPTGPLAPKKRNWVQTFAQAIESRRREAHAKCLNDEVP